MIATRRAIASLIAAATLGGTGHAQAQQADQVVPPAAISGAIAPADETFALFAGSASLAQIEGARIALKHAQRNEVRDFAETTVKMNAQALEELRRVVSARGSKLPPTPTGRHADMVTKLSGVAPAEVADAFIRRFGVDANKETIALYERHAKEGQDPALRQYALAALEQLRERMAAAQKLAHATGSTR